MTVALTPARPAAKAADRYIYIAAPWGPTGGGMFKVADYLIQAQQPPPTATGYARLRPLDTRGAGSAAASAFVVAAAVARVVGGRMSGRLAGVHVNMAERLSLVRKSIVVIACRALGVPSVLHLHAARLHHLYPELPRPLRAAVRWAFSLPSVCVVLGGASERFVTGELGVPRHKVRIVRNGVPGPVVPRRPDGPARQSWRVLFLGNLAERKGVTDLLRALAMMPLEAMRAGVDIAGGGDVEHYRAVAAELGVAAFVRFPGWVDQAAAGALLANADVLVLPSFDEGLPLVILEAMANGVAVVCTPVGEIPAALTDGVHACFVEPGDAAGLAAALTRVLTEPAFRRALERNGRALFVERYSLDGFFSTIAELHRQHFGVSAHAAAPADGANGDAR